MERRLNGMIEASEKTGSGPFPEELMAAGIEACTRVLTLRQADRGSKFFQALEELANQLMERFPTSMDLNFSQEELQDRGIHELDIIEYRKRPEKLEAIRARAELALEQYKSSVTASAAQPSGESGNGKGPEEKPEEQPVDKKKLEEQPGEQGSAASSQAEVYALKPQVLDVSGLTLKAVVDGASRSYVYQRTVNGKQEEPPFLFTPEQPRPNTENALKKLEEQFGKASPFHLDAFRELDKFSTTFRERKALPLDRLQKKLQAEQLSTANFRTYELRYRQCLREDELSLTETENISDESFANKLDAYLLSRARILERGKQYDRMGIQPGEPTALRSAAMSAVADALGIGSLLAASRPMTLVKDGVPMQGVVTEQAQGCDCRNPVKDDLILQVSGPLALSPEAVKDLASMQVLDYLCGNLNRTEGSMFYQFTEDGNGRPILNGIQGVENDMSFAGGNTQAQSALQERLEGLQHIPESLARRVMDLDQTRLKNMLQAFRLPAEQQNQAAERLAAVQQRIRKGLEQFKGKEPSAVSRDCIHVLSDQAYETLSADAVNRLPIKRFVDRAPATAALHNQLAALNAFREDDRKLMELFRQTEKSNKNVMFGSKEFDAMKDALLELRKARQALATPTPEEEKQDKKLHTPTDDEMKSIRDRYVTLNEAVDQYLQRKQKQLQQKGRMDQKGLDRMDLAMRIQKELRPNLRNIQRLGSALHASRQLRQPEQPQAEAVVSAGGKAQEPPTIKARLEELTRFFEEQRKLRSQDISGKKDPSVGQIMQRKALRGKLLEAFGLAELSRLCGSEQLKVDDKLAENMRGLVETNPKKNPTEYNACLRAVREALQQNGFKTPSPELFHDMRLVVDMNLKNRDKAPEGLRKLTELLQEPNSLPKKLKKLAEENKKGSQQL